MMTDKEVIDLFDKRFGTGFNFLIPNSTRAKEFILDIRHQDLADIVEKIRVKLVEFAMEGGKQPDELKGLDLYSRMLAYLKALPTSEGKKV
jgi:hypothetical protein